MSAQLRRVYSAKASISFKSTQLGQKGGPARLGSVSGRSPWASVDSASFWTGCGFAHFGPVSGLLSSEKVRLPRASVRSTGLGRDYSPQAEVGPIISGHCQVHSDGEAGWI